MAGKRAWMYQDMFELALSRCGIPREARNDIVNVLEHIGCDDEGCSSDMFSRQRVAAAFKDGTKAREPVVSPELMEKLSNG